MARTLAANVYVGETLYRKGTSPDKEIADQITFAKAWGEEPEKPEKPAPAPAPADPGPDADTAAPAKKAAPKKPAKKTAAKK